MLYLGPLFVVTSVTFWLTVPSVARRLCRSHPRSVAIFLLLYVGSYVPLSMNGEYALANHGGQHWTRSWCPRYVIEVEVGRVGRPKIHLSHLAVIFWPLFVADTWLWHPAMEPWDGYWAE